MHWRYGINMTFLLIFKGFIFYEFKEERYLLMMANPPAAGNGLVVETFKEFTATVKVKNPGETDWKVDISTFFIV
jgi:hypothetical protein